jgi:hypothetical protein
MPATVTLKQSVSSDEQSSQGGRVSGQIRCSPPASASQVANQYGSVMGQADRIKRAADDMVAKVRARKHGPKVKEAVDRILTTLAKLKDHQMKGSNDPLLKAQAEYGVRQHKTYSFCPTKEDVGYVVPSTSVSVPERAE